MARLLVSVLLTLISAGRKTGYTRLVLILHYWYGLVKRYDDALGWMLPLPAGFKGGKDL